MKSMPASAVLSMCLAVMIAIGGCAATATEMRYGELKVENKMSASIFLTPVSKEKRTVYVEVRNTSDKPFQIEAEVAAEVIKRGYTLVDDPNKAHYLLQANVLSVGEMDKSALEENQAVGFGGALGGAAVGGLVSHSWEGALIGGLIGVATELVTGNLVKVNTYGVVTDLQISERAPGAVSEEFKSVIRQGTAQTSVKQDTARSTRWKQYQTRIISSARSTNLEFETAYPHLRKGLVTAIAGIM